MRNARAHVAKGNIPCRTFSAAQKDFDFFFAVPAEEPPEGPGGPPPEPAFGSMLRTTPGPVMPLLITKSR